MTITEFLLARIAEDEAALERRGAFPHSTHGLDAAGAYNPRCPDCLGLPGKARVLAECKAKRAIIGLHADREGDCEQCSCYGYFAVTDGFHDHEEFPCPTLCATATVYADHQDYDPAWISQVGE